MRKLRIASMLCMCLLGVSVIQAQTTDPITIESLLHERVDRGALARLPQPDFRLKQDSSYNRASVTPDDARGWFTNKDYNSKDSDINFIRVEENSGRKEWVLMEDIGAGALVRSWMPWRGQKNPTTTSTIRFSPDGVREPALEGNMFELFQGKGLVPFPLAHESLRSAVSFFPIPYAYSWGGRSTDFYEHPFHAQPFCHSYNKLNRKTDSNEKNTLGYSTETRTRALDTMPFASSLQLDMEVWSWTDCDMGYGVGVSWYGNAETTSNRKPDPDKARRLPPVPEMRTPEADSEPASALSENSGFGQAEQPNVIIIFADDLGYGDLGCFGSQTIKTPHIDRMAREGLRFTNFYAQTVCGPSRAALMTGCYPLRVAVEGNRVEVHPHLHTNEITMAEVLKEVG